MATECPVLVTLLTLILLAPQESTVLIDQLIHPSQASCHIHIISEDIYYSANLNNFSTRETEAIL